MKWVARLLRMFRITVKEEIPVIDLNRKFDTSPGTINVIGDMPPEAEKALKELSEKEQEQKAKEEEEAAIKAMKENMERYNNALNNTFEEIQNGFVSVKKEE